MPARLVATPVCASGVGRGVCACVPFCACHQVASCGCMLVVWVGVDRQLLTPGHKHVSPRAWALLLQAGRQPLRCW